MPLKLIFRDLEYSLENVRLRVGRAEQLDITISGDPLVSSQHCVITNGRLLDAQSTNGTQINKVKIAYGKPYVLKAGDVVTIGETSLRIEEGIPYADRNKSSSNSTSSFPSSSSLATSTSPSSSSSNLSSPIHINNHSHHSLHSPLHSHPHHAHPHPHTSYNSTQQLLNNHHHNFHATPLHIHDGMEDDDHEDHAPGQGTADPTSTTSDSDSSDGDEDADGDGDGDEPHASPSMSGGVGPTPHDSDPLAWLPSYKTAQGPLSPTTTKVKFDPFAMKRDAALAAAHAAAQAHNDQVSKIVRFSPASVDSDGTSKPLADPLVGDAHVAQYEEEIWELKRLLSQSENRCLQMKKKLSHQQRRQNVQQTKSRMQKFEAQVQSLEYQMLYGDSKKDGEIDELKDQLRQVTAASDELLSLRGQHVALVSKLASVEQQLTEAQQQLTTQQQHHDTVAQQHTTHTNTLETTITSLQQQVDTQQRQIQQHVTELCILRDELSKQRSSHEQQLTSLTTQHKSTLEEHITTQQSQQQQIHILKAQHQVHLERVEQLTKELSASQSEFRSTLKLAHEHEVAHQLSSSQLTHAQQEIIELKKQLKQKPQPSSQHGNGTVSREEQQQLSHTLQITQTRVKQLTIGLGCVVAVQLAGFYALAHKWT